LASDNDVWVARIFLEGVTEMSYVMVMESPNGSQSEYDEVSGKLNLDSPGTEWPKGFLSHFAGPTEDGGWCIVDEWETKEDFQNFFENRLKPAMGESTGTPMHPKWFRVYKKYSGESQDWQGVRRAA
jgi:hypothetical protein